MKNNNTLSIIALSIIALLGINSVKAQIVYQNGKINIGDANIFSNYSININGMNGLLWTEANNKFLQISLTSTYPSLAGNNNRIAFYNPTTNIYNRIMVGNVLQPLNNDINLTETHTINDGLYSILNLHPVSGNMENEEDGQSVTYGFIGEEIERILPDVVYTDDNDNKLIDYNAIIPLLVSSIQELQATVVEQSAIIDKVLRGEGEKSQGQIISISPNPTHGKVSITYTISERTDNAYFLITNLTGKFEKTIKDICNSSSVTEDLSTLNRGIHILSLVVNGVSADTKQIIIE